MHHKGRRNLGGGRRLVVDPVRTNTNTNTTTATANANANAAATAAPAAAARGRGRRDSLRGGEEEDDWRWEAARARRPCAAARRALGDFEGVVESAGGARPVVVRAPLLA